MNGVIWHLIYRNCKQRIGYWIVTKLSPKYQLFEFEGHCAKSKSNFYGMELRPMPHPSWFYIKKVLKQIAYSSFNRTGNSITFIVTLLKRRFIWTKNIFLEDFMAQLWLSLTWWALKPKFLSSKKKTLRCLPTIYYSLLLASLAVLMLINSFLYFANIIFSVRLTTQLLMRCNLTSNLLV